MAKGTIKVNTSSRYGSADKGGYLDFPVKPNQNALILCNHPFFGRGGAYIITGGYPEGKIITTLKESADIASVEAIDTHTVRVTTTSTGNQFITCISLGGGKALPLRIARRCAA